jgi:lipopolysaccharide export LptBFGC system permease protein LptF
MTSNDRMGFAIVITLLIVIFCLELIPETESVWDDTSAEKKQVERLKEKVIKTKDKIVVLDKEEKRLQGFLDTARVNKDTTAIVFIQDEIINNLRSKEVNYLENEVTYDSIICKQDTIIKVQDEQIAIRDSQIKKLKRQKMIAIVGGSVILVTILILSL